MKTFNTGRRQVLARLALNAGGAVGLFNLAHATSLPAADLRLKTDPV